MSQKNYNNNTLSTHRPTQKVASHMSNFICQHEINMANESLKVQLPLLESSSEMDKLWCITNTAHSPVTKIGVMGTFSLSRILSDGEFQLTEPWSTKMLEKVVEVQKCNMLVP